MERRRRTGLLSGRRKRSGMEMGMATRLVR
jgi:hypothetical protein